MDINSIIDKLEDLCTNARKIPMTGLITINETEIYDVVDEMRASMPEELKQARWIVKEKQEILEETEKESNKLIEEARKKSQDMASETEVYKLAEQKANEIIEEARNKEREIRLGAEDYADEMLANLEVNLGKLLTAVQRGRDRLQGKTEVR
jgi:cell division septum initiation protein DivIVA